MKKKGGGGGFSGNYLKLVHGALMAAGWAVCIIFGIIVARYVPKKLEWWFPVHIFFQSLGLILILGKKIF